MKNMKYYFISLISSLGLVLLVIFFLPLSNEKYAVAQEEILENKRSVLTVSLISPAEEHWPVSIRASGYIEPWQEEIVSSEISNIQLTDLFVEVGSQIVKGQELARLSQKNARIEIDKKQALLAKAQANLEKANLDYKRAQNLKNKGSLSAQKIDEYLIATKTARAELASAQAELEGAQLNLEQTRIIALDDGVIASKSVNIGEVVSAGKELFRIIRQRKIEWVAEVNANEIPTIKIQQQAILTQSDGQPLTGIVRRITPQADSNTGRIKVYVTLDDSTQAMSGTYASGHIRIGDKEALTVPEKSIVQYDGHNYVYRLKDKTYVERVPVMVGRRYQDKVEILHNLSLDDALVETGGGFLSDGAKVTVVSSLASNKTQIQGQTL